MRGDRRDVNEKDLVAFAEAMGAKWLPFPPSQPGQPDGVFGFRGKNFLVEFKQPGKRLREDQEEWHRTWPGQVSVIHTEMELRELLGLADPWRKDGSGKRKAWNFGRRKTKEAA